MKIAESVVQMSSSHRESTRHEVHERLRLWTGRRADLAAQERAAPPAAEAVALSAAGKAAQGGEAAAIEAARDAVDKDPVLQLLRAMIAYLTGRSVDVFDAGDLAGAAAPEAADANPRPGGESQPGVEYERRESTVESEDTRFAAAGVVRTADGREISFSLSLQMSRSFREDSELSLRRAEAPKKDPLVINFSGQAAELGDRRFSIDLDGDGTAESAHFVAAGSGFLVFDRNADGRINDGREMFGPGSGDGFAELAKLDADGNGWIDESDPAYAGLRVWTKSADGADRLQTLAETGVGAIGLGRLATPFDLKDANNTSRGEVRSSGVYLREDGSAGTVQQIDLTV